MSSRNIFTEVTYVIDIRFENVLLSDAGRAKADVNVNHRVGSYGRLLIDGSVCSIIDSACKI